MAVSYYADASVSEALIGNIVRQSNSTKDASALARDPEIDASTALAGGFDWRC
jgi:hypothetical protein